MTNTEDTNPVADPDTLLWATTKAIYPGCLIGNSGSPTRKPTSWKLVKDLAKETSGKRIYFEDGTDRWMGHATKVWIAVEAPVVAPEPEYRSIIHPGVLTQDQVRLARYCVASCQALEQAKRNRANQVADCLTGGMSLRQVAELTGLSKSAIAKIAAGQA